MSNLWQDAVYDRTQSDVDRVKELLASGRFSALTEAEQTEWLNGSKGSLNTSDLARIKNNMELLIEVLELANICSDVPTFPQADYFDEVLVNLKAIRNSGFIYNTTPAIPSAPLNTFSKWNDIEKILTDVYNILLHNFHYYAGENLYAGDTVADLL